MAAAASASPRGTCPPDQGGEDQPGEDDRGVGDQSGTCGTEPDLDDLDEERRGWTRDRLVAELLATRPADEDLVVCHGDLTLDNVLFDPDTCRVTGVLDAGRLGVADRWVDLAIATRSLGSAASRFL